MAELTINYLLHLADSNLNLAQNHFEEQYSWKRVILKVNSIESKIELEIDSIIAYGFKMCMQILQKFGCKIVLLTADFTETLEYYCQYLEQQISEYCASSLFHLKLIHIAEHFNLGSNVYEKLQTLEFQWCSIAGQITNFNFWFPNLRRLKFTSWNKIDQNCVTIQYSALRELITTVFIPLNLRHFNISTQTFTAIRNLNPNLSTSIITSYNL